MDIRGISAINHIGSLQGVSLPERTTLTGTLGPKRQADGTMFEAMLNSAIDNLNTTNSYLSDAENEEIKFALGEVDNTHDLTIALQKASTALQYTVAVRDKLMEAYKEIMQMQI